MKAIGKKELFLYGQFAIPFAMIGLPLYVYMPTFYHSDVGLSVFFVGLILFLARVTDIFTDPLFGYLSDRMLYTFKSRKILVLLGSAVLILSFYALLNPLSGYEKIWLFVFAMLIYIGWSMVTIPYLTWSAELSPHYHEKTKLNASRELFTIIGVIIALSVPYILGVSDSAKKTLDLLLLTFILLFIPIAFLTMLYLKPKSKANSYQLSLDLFKQVYTRLPQVKQLQVAYFINSLANALPATLFLYFVQLVLGRSDATGWLLLLYFFCGIIALPFWYLLSQKLNSKKRTWMLSIALACSVFIFVPFLQEGDIVYFVIISVLSGFCLGADMALPSSIQSDIAQDAERSNIAYAGFLFGFWSMITKFSLACAILVSFSLLALVGFDQNAPTPTSLLMLSLLYGLFPVLLKLIVLWLLRSFQEQKVDELT